MNCFSRNFISFNFSFHFHRHSSVHTSTYMYSTINLKFFKKNSKNYETEAIFFFPLFQMKFILIASVAIISLCFAIPDCKICEKTIFHFSNQKFTIFCSFNFFFFSGSYEPALPVIPGCDFLG